MPEPAKPLLSQSTSGPRLGSGLSLAAHALVVAMLVQVTVLPAGLPDPPSETVMVEVAASEAPPARPEPQPQLQPNVAEAKPIPKPAPRASPPRPMPVASPSQMDVPTPASGPADDTGAASVAAMPAPPAGTGASVAADEALAIYGQTIWRLIAERKPRGLRLAGTVLVRFSLDRDGSLLVAEISGPAESAALNQVALTAVRAAAPFPPPPATIPDSRMTFLIPFQVR